ncbi:ATP-binding protein [Beijerinckia indica]|uniref:ATP-binding protein n=1 Tax=Beijerinckia indica TaxID=533 RepID=UPI0013053E67|nr:ATP-binding protein [Beijerinckia indica]
MTHRLLLFGVSGVGKTTACRSYTLRHANVLCLNAGSLLSAASHCEANELRSSSSDAIIRRQFFLADALDRQLRGCNAELVIIDGHAIIDNNRELVRVPVEVVQSLKPHGLLLLEASVSDIFHRRLERKQCPYRSELELSLEMEQERQAVESYANELGLPFEKACSTKGFELDAIVQAIRPRLG